MAEDQETPDEPIHPNREFVEIPDAAPEESLGDRFTRLRERAKEIGCDLDVGIVIGGVRRNELYRVYNTSEEDASLIERLDDAEGLLADVRMKATAEATKRMIEAEDIARLTVQMVKDRQAEYRIAQAALRQATEIGETPADLDAAQDILTRLASIEIGKTPGEALAEILAKAAQPEADQE